MLEWLDKLNRLESRIASALPERLEQRSSQFADLSLGEFIACATPRFEALEHLDPLIAIFERIAAGEPVEVVVSMPPRHGKTETLLHAIAWLLARDPRKQLAYASYQQTFTEDKSRKARGIARAVGVPISKESAARNNWTTGFDDGGLWATSIGGPITGKGFHVCILDDLVKGRAESESALIRDRAYEWFKGDVYTRIEPGGSCIVNMTRWHPDDIAGRLIAEGWEHINLAAINERGEALWPAKWPVELLRKREKVVGPYEWSSLYQGEPRSKGGRVFGDTNFYDALPEGYRVTIGVDFAYTAKTYADYSVAVVLARKGDTCFVLDVVRAQVKPEDFAQHIANLASTYKGARFESYVSTTEQGITSLLRKLGGVPINGRLAKADKFVRAQPVAAAWNAGNVLIPSAKYLATTKTKADWLDAFVAEVCGFTGVKDRHDDQVDALASAFDASVWQPTLAKAPPPIEPLPELDDRPLRDPF